MLFFIAVAMTMAVAALRVHPLRMMRLFHRTLHASSQLPVRICMLVLSFLMVLAGAFGLDATPWRICRRHGYRSRRAG